MAALVVVSIQMIWLRTWVEKCITFFLLFRVAPSHWPHFKNRQTFFVVVAFRSCLADGRCFDEVRHAFSGRTSFIWSEVLQNVIWKNRLECHSSRIWDSLVGLFLINNFLALMNNSSSESKSANFKGSAPHFNWRVLVFQTGLSFMWDRSSEMLTPFYCFADFFPKTLLNSI